MTPYAKGDVEYDACKPAKDAREDLSRDRDLSWDEVMKRYSPEFPSFPFEDWRISIDRLCHVNGERFELKASKKTVEVCRDSDYDRERCLRSEEVKVSIPRLADELYCPVSRDGYHDECDLPATRKVVRPLTYEVDVYRRSMHEDRVPLFTKTYAIPACP